MPPAVPESVLEQLRKYDTPTVCNVLELFECRPRTAGYMDARIRACYPALPPMVGFATTATFNSTWSQPFPTAPTPTTQRYFPSRFRSPMWTMTRPALQSRLHPV